MQSVKPLLLVFCWLPLRAAVTFDAAASSNWAGTAVTTRSTPAFTVGAGANRAAMIFLSMAANNATGITASLGGVSGVLITGTDTTTGTSSGRTMIFCVTNPPSGSRTATASWTGSMDADIAVITVSGADQTTPCNNGSKTSITSNAAATISVTITSTSGDLTASVAYDVSGPWNATTPTNQTKRWGIDSTITAGDTGPGTGTTTHTWTAQYLNDTQDVSGANFKVAGGAVSSVRHRAEVF